MPYQFDVVMTKHITFVLLQIVYTAVYLKKYKYYQIPPAFISFTYLFYRLYLRCLFFSAVGTKLQPVQTLREITLLFK